MAKQYIYLVSVDGMQAPKFEHSTLDEAKKEAERLAAMHGNQNRTIRVLRQEAVLTAKQTISYTWSK